MHSEIAWLEVNLSDEDLDHQEPLDFDIVPSVTQLLEARFTRCVRQSYINLRELQVDYQMVIDDND